MTVQRNGWRYGVGLAGLVLLLAGCGGGDDAEDAVAEAPTTTVAAETTTTTESPATTTTEASDPFDDLPGWASAALAGRAFDYGRVRVLSFAPAFSFDAPEGSGKFCVSGAQHWDYVPISQTEVVDEETGFFEVPVARLVGTRLSQPSLDETVEALAGAMALDGPFEAYEIDGATGVRFDGPSAPAGDETIYIDIGCTLTFSRQEYWYFWIVDVGGDVVTFSLHTPVDIAEEMVAEAEMVLQSIDWRDL